MAIDYKHVIESFQKRDDQYAKLFLEAPEKFSRVISSDKDMNALQEYIQKTYAPNALPIMGGLALMASEAVRPTDDHIKSKLAGRGLKFHDASSNGAFLVYNTCCAAPNNTMFFKIAKGDNVDALEIEALGLQLVKRLVSPGLRKYFLSYCSTGKVICHLEKPSTYSLPITHLLDGSLFKDSRKYGMNRGYVPVPFLMTRAVPSGLSLQTIIHTWERLPKDQNSIDSMAMFLKNNNYEQVIKDGKFPAESKKKVCDHLMARLEDFFEKVLKASTPLSMGHADLHIGNILFDALNDNFVMIDFGRVTMDLKKLKIPATEIWNEYLKIATQPLPTDAAITLRQDPNAFFKFYDNVNSRYDYATYPDKLATYSMLFDFAGLSYLLVKKFARLFNYKSKVAGVVAFKGASNPSYIVFMSKKDITDFLQKHGKKLSIFDMSLVFFALAIHSLIDVNFNGITTYLRVTTKDLLAVPESLVMNSDGSTIFYSWGQPWEAHLSKIMKPIDANCKAVGFYQILDDLLSKVKIPSSSAGGGSRHRRTRMTPVQIDKLSALTQFNYAKRAQAIRRNGKKTSKSISFVNK